MRELQYLRARSLKWRDVPEPMLLFETDALVRPFVAARCDGDALFLQRDAGRMLSWAAKLHVCDATFGAPHSNPFLGPFAYGHECVAEVTHCGSAVRSVSVGDVVSVPWSLSCGNCPECSAGLTSKCRTLRKEHSVAAYGFGGGFGQHGGMVSDLLRVPFADAMLVGVPSNVDPFAAASASDNLCDAYRTVAPYLSQTRGAPVLIVGGSAKSIGLYAVGVAKALGASHIDYLDTSRTRLSLAEQLGANAIAVKRTEPWYERGEPLLRGGYPISVDASSTAEGLNYALGALAPGGTCTGIGFYLHRSTPVSLWKMYLKCATLRIGIAHPRADLAAVLQLLADGPFDPRRVNTLVASWEDAPRALLERTTKVVLSRPRLAA